MLQFGYCFGLISLYLGSNYSSKPWGFYEEVENVLQEIKNIAFNGAFKGALYVLYIFIGFAGRPESDNDQCCTFLLKPYFHKDKCFIILSLSYTKRISYTIVKM